MKAILLAGGMGKRLAPYTTVLPKPLMPVGDMPILEIVIRQLRAHGITDITLSVGYLGSLLEAFFGDGSKLGVSIAYSYEETPLGTAGPIGLVDGLDEPFLVMNGDVLTTLDYSDMLAFHGKHGGIATVGLTKKMVNIDLGVVQVDEQGRIASYIEKPTLEYLVSMGIYVFSPSVLGHIKKGVHLNLNTLILDLKEKKEKVVGYQGEFEWLDIGRPEDYVRAGELLLSNRSQYLPEAG